MLNKYFILQILNSLNVNSARSLALKMGVNFSLDETELFLTYLKENGNYLISLEFPLKKIYIDLHQKTSIDSLNKLFFLLSKLGFK